MSATTSAPVSHPSPAKQIDLDLIAHRILKLAEIAALEHIENLALSQAHRLVELANRDN